MMDPSPVGIRSYREAVKKGVGVEGEEDNKGEGTRSVQVEEGEQGSFVPPPSLFCPQMTNSSISRGGGGCGDDVDVQEERDSSQDWTTEPYLKGTETQIQNVVIEDRQSIPLSLPSLLSSSSVSDKHSSMSKMSVNIQEFNSLLDRHLQDVDVISPSSTERVQGESNGNGCASNSESDAVSEGQGASSMSPRCCCGTVELESPDEIDHVCTGCLLEHWQYGRLGILGSGSTTDAWFHGNRHRVNLVLPHIKQIPTVQVQQCHVDSFFKTSHLLRSQNGLDGDFNNSRLPPDFDVMKLPPLCTDQQNKNSSNASGGSKKEMETNTCNLNVVNSGSQTDYLVSPVIAFVPSCYNAAYQLSTSTNFGNGIGFGIYGYYVNNCAVVGTASATLAGGGDPYSFGDLLPILEQLELLNWRSCMVPEYVGSYDQSFMEKVAQGYRLFKEENPSHGKPKTKLELAPGTERERKQKRKFEDVKAVEGPKNDNAAEISWNPWKSQDFLTIFLQEMKGGQMQDNALL